MKHKANLLLLGFTNYSDFDFLNKTSITKANSMSEAIELLTANNFNLIISKYELCDANAIDLSKSLKSLKNYYKGDSKKKFKLLILTSSSEQEAMCKQNNILYYPENMNLRSLIVRLIDLPVEPQKEDKNLAIIDFKELFIRVDNNREFIKEVIEKFFEIKESRISDIKTPLVKSDFKKAKDAAHKLKGVLANFSMLKARATIIELEKLILNEEHKAALEKLNELILEIEKTVDFYHRNEDQFKNVR